LTLLFHWFKECPWMICWRSRGSSFARCIALGPQSVPASPWGGQSYALKLQEPALVHKAVKSYEPGYLRMDVKYRPQMRDESTRRYLFVAIDRAMRWVFVRILAHQCTGLSEGTAQSLRSSHADSESATPRVADLDLDLLHRRAFRNDRRLDPAGKESGLMELLMHRHGGVLPHSRIASQVWA